MTQQVLVIHGGDAFANYDEYISSLRSFVVDLTKKDGLSWKRNLVDNLGEPYEVFTPRMPNSADAKYLEWKIIFEKYIEALNDNLILVGHSLGGVFLAKYLSEEKISKKILATFFIAAPYDEDGRRKLPEFSVTHPLDKLKEQAGKLFFYHSKDDPVVMFSEIERYQKELPSATFRIFEDRQHFNQENIPELVEDIKMVTGQ